MACGQSEVHKDKIKTNNNKNHKHTTAESGMHCIRASEVGPVLGDSVPGAETSRFKVTPWTYSVTGEWKASSMAHRGPPFYNPPICLSSNLSPIAYSSHLEQPWEQHVSCNWFDIGSADKRLIENVIDRANVRSGCCAKVTFTL